MGARYNLKHGMARVPKSKEYQTWRGMRERCLNPRGNAYKNYGGRGIKICKRWDRFENFYADMGKKPVGMTLDRRNSNGDYSPSNCRWASRKTQGQNTIICYRWKINGIVYNSSRDAANAVGVSESTIRAWAKGEIKNMNRLYVGDKMKSASRVPLYKNATQAA